MLWYLAIFWRCCNSSNVWSMFVVCMYVSIMLCMYIKAVLYLLYVSNFSYSHMLGWHFCYQYNELCVCSLIQGGNTALHEAARYGHNEVVDRLVSSKCDVNVTNAVSWFILLLFEFLNNCI